MLELAPTEVDIWARRRRIVALAEVRERRWNLGSCDCWRWRPNPLLVFALINSLSWWTREKLALFFVRGHVNRTA